ncbi:MAG: tetratricopeptide repeat protein [Nitrospirae bacterium]|nr:tetratricopeptide repeat protein [Nitrospirota bacterium]
MTDSKEDDILAELKKHTSFSKQSNRLNIVAIFILVIFVMIALTAPAYIHRLGTSHKLTSQKIDTWHEARNLMDNGNLPSALQMIKRMIDKNPSYYYGYALIGTVYHEMGDLEKAEQNYAKAYDLFPLEDNEKTLKAIREAIKKKQK